MSVTTNAARYQELSLNPQKLAGQCSKLKCCLNYEIDSYMDERKDFPSAEIQLNTILGKATHLKTDVFRHIMWYVVEGENGTNIVPLAVEKVKEIIKINGEGEKGEITPIKASSSLPKTENLDYTNVVGQESLTRFDDQKGNRHKKKKKRKKIFRKNESK